MSSWERQDPPGVITQECPGARLWSRNVGDGMLRVLRTHEQHEEGGPFLLHVSISHSTPFGKPGRYPTWDEQKEAVWRFAPGKEMVHYLPPEGELYVNAHAATFHWWETR